MRPNTKVYPFFDNIDVSSYVTPDGGSLGGNVVTDANGYVKGTFAIPDPNVSSNPRWRTGKRVFRLTVHLQIVKIEQQLLLQQKLIMMQKVY